MFLSFFGSCDQLSACAELRGIRFMHAELKTESWRL